MPRVEIRTSAAPTPTAGYSQGIVAGRMVWVCGQVGNDPVTGIAVAADAGAQTRQALRNIHAILAEAGAGLADVVAVYAYLETLEDFEAYDEAYQALMPQPFPARVTVAAGVAPFLVEIAVTAVLPG